jgi:hypothetical protein
MLDYLLNTAQAFEREHGVVPDVIYINPLHYEQLTRQSPELFVAGSRLRMGFRLVIVPASVYWRIPGHPCLTPGMPGWPTTPERDRAPMLWRGGAEVERLQRGYW